MSYHLEGHPIFLLILLSSCHLACKNHGPGVAAADDDDDDAAVPAPPAPAAAAAAAAAGGGAGAGLFWPVCVSGLESMGQVQMPVAPSIPTDKMTLVRAMCSGDPSRERPLGVGLYSSLKPQQHQILNPLSEASD